MEHKLYVLMRAKLKDVEVAAHLVSEPGKNSSLPDQLLLDAFWPALEQCRKAYFVFPSLLGLHVCT